MTIYYVMILTCILAMLTIICHVHGNVVLSKSSRFWFTLAFLGNIFGATAECLGAVLDRHPVSPAFHSFVTLSEFCLTPLIAVFLSFACGVKKPAIPVFILLQIHVALELILLPFGKIFWIDGDGVYHRGPLYPIYIASYVISFGYLFLMFILLSRHFHNRKLPMLLLCSFVVLSGLVPSLVDGKIKTAYLGMCMMSLLLYFYYEGLTEQDLSDELAQQNERIKTMQKKTILGIADIIESRDQNTGTHVNSTSHYVRLLADAALEQGLYPETITPHYVDVLEHAAPMHDVGKITVPDAVLRKPEALSEEEFEVMKTHTTEGGKIVQRILEEITDEDYTKVAYDLAMYHHEKWDGSGYPEGRSGEAIPLSARIMAIADVYDALTMERVYKRAFTKEEALSVIKKDAGIHFDPLLAPLFVQLMEG